MVTTPNWHALSPADALAHHRADIEHGLSENEAAVRLAQHGPNCPTAAPARSQWRRFADQLSQPLVLVLIGAGTVTALLSEWVDSGVIFGVVAMNAIIGYMQEGKAASALAALRQAVATEVTVLRDGRRQRIDAIGLTPGDVVWLCAGDKVPADLRLLDGKQLRTVEAALTGESDAAAKHPAALAHDTPLAERRNMAYAGTIVVAGQGHGLVVAIGDSTETGRIGTLIATAPDLTTPLTKKMGQFANMLLWAILVLAGLTMLIGWLRGEALYEMFMAAVALAVGAIPEGLPAAMTITLAIGVSRMAKRRAIIRNLPSVETLGSTTVICSDKTGTLTENAMTVTELWCGGDTFGISGTGYAPLGEIHRGPARDSVQPSTLSEELPAAFRTDMAPASSSQALRELLSAGVLCNDATLIKADGRWQITGDPTEAALLVVARKGGLDEIALRSAARRRDELPFDSARQAMATVHDIDGQSIIYIKGASEKLLPACLAIIDATGRENVLDDVTHAKLDVVAGQMAARGLRVLALARLPVSADVVLDETVINSRLIFLGLVGMIDPPRDQAAAAVKACHTAGIRVKMITGDHAETARAIAHQIGIAGHTNASVLTGRELAAQDDLALIATAQSVDIFARVEPEQKLRLVRALQARGEVVAMTGDGVNDAPALRQADIGIAMGLGGTDVAKEAAAMVLTDDNFATIEAAIEEGRGIYDNLVKFITWTLPTNFGEGLVILAAIVAGVTLPITPLQILWINMTTAVLLGLPLALEPTEPNIMRRPPRATTAPILNAELVGRIVLVGALMLLACFGLFLYCLNTGGSIAEARTIAVNGFVAIETVYLFSCRSLSQPLHEIPLFSNPWVWWGSGATAMSQLSLTYWAPLNHLFGTVPITSAAWCQIALVALTASLFIETEKLCRRRLAGLRMK